MSSLPPLECLRFFEAAARHRSFTAAALELGCTRAAVSHRVRTLEAYLELALFDRRPRGIRLNRHGSAYLREVGPRLAALANTTDRHRVGPEVRRLNIIAVEPVAERWIMPRLPAFRAIRPDIAITLETDLLAVDTKWQDFDIWIAYSGGVGEPCAMTAFPETVVEETLFEEALFPVGSPGLIERLGRPRTPADLLDWPLLYHLGWPTDWSLWFRSQGEAGPDLSRASGFRVFGMALRAAVEGMGAFVGRPSAIGEELEQGTLVPLFERQRQARSRCRMVTAGDARHRDEVRMFRDWILRQAAVETEAGPATTR